MMLRGKTDGASSGLIGASSSSGRTLLTLDVSCWEPFDPKGELHS